MKRKISSVTILLLQLLTTVTVFAQSSGNNDLSWSSIDGGGGEASGGYALISTVGQANAGTLQGGSYTLAGGFLAGVSSPLTVSCSVYLPLVLR